MCRRRSGEQKLRGNEAGECRGYQENLGPNARNRRGIPRFARNDVRQTQEGDAKPPLQVEFGLGGLWFGGSSEIFEAVHFPFGQGTDFSGRNVEGEGAELDALDFLDQEAYRQEHAPDLAIAAFDESEFVPGIFHVLEQADFSGRELHATVVAERDGDAVAKFLDGLVVGLAADFDVICFGDVRAGLGEFLCQCAIVGEEKKTFAGVVETADGIDAFREIAEELHDGGAAFGVANGGDVTFGFVQKKIDEALWGTERLAIDRDGVGEGVGFGAEFGDDFAVQGDPTGGDDFFGFAAGSDAGGGQDFLEAIHGELSVFCGQLTVKKKEASG